MTVTLALAVTGTDDEPRWAVMVQPTTYSPSSRRYCCEAGHWTPEAAAAHGSELAAAMLARDARQQSPAPAGGLAIAKLEAT